MHRLAYLAVLLPTAAAAMDTLPTARDDSVLGAFQANCLREAPDFERLEGQAKALGMADLGDHAAPGPDGGTVESHRWGGKLPDGPFALYVARVPRRGAVETSCGVSGTVPDVEHFRAGLVRTMALPIPGSREQQTDGSSVAIWPDYPLRDHRLILQTRTTKEGNGFVLVTIAVKQASPSAAAQ